MDGGAWWGTWSGRSRKEAAGRSQKTGFEHRLAELSFLITWKPEPEAWVGPYLAHLPVGPGGSKCILVSAYDCMTKPELYSGSDWKRIIRPLGLSPYRLLP